jgi:hypothetical protein
VQRAKEVNIKGPPDSLFLAGERFENMLSSLPAMTIQKANINLMKINNQFLHFAGSAVY